jgi:hypothetical protein
MLGVERCFFQPEKDCFGEALRRLPDPRRACYPKQIRICSRLALSRRAQQTRQQSAVATPEKTKMPDVDVGSSSGIYRCAAKTELCVTVVFL